MVSPEPSTHLDPGVVSPEPSTPLPVDPTPHPALQVASFEHNFADEVDVTEYVYDLRNNLIQVKSYTSSNNYFVTAAYTYDAKGQTLTSTTGDYTTSYTYDALGNVSRIVYPGGGEETFKYNAAGKVTESTDRNGIVTIYTYDLMGNLLSMSAGGKSITYTYAPTGSVVSETSEAGTTTYEYDDMGRKISETSDGNTTEYKYDLDGNVLEITSNGSTTTYTYDSLNRLIRTENGSDSAEYTYDGGGRRTNTVICSATGIVYESDYTYNYIGEIKTQKNYSSSGELISSFSYTYDLNGNVTSEVDSTSGTTNYYYDKLGRLVGEIGGGTSRYYTYDSANNRTEAIVDTVTRITYNYDSAGRLVSEMANNGQISTVTSYTYDANGNLISKTENGKTTNYAFDVWGHMTSAAGATYTYNSSGIRTSKTVNGKTTNFTLVGGCVCFDGTYNYVWGAELITNGSVYYVYNAHGDVIQLLDASGNLIKTYDYDAYGNELTRDLSDANPFRYCGEYYDTETGLIYLRARYYDPNTGRFISQDPHWNVKNMIYGDASKSSPDRNAIIQSSNRYSYCMNNPIMYKDPLGLWSWPGEVHQAVINNIMEKYGDDYKLIKELNIDLSDGKIGRADLVMQLSKEVGWVWELKRIRRNNPNGYLSRKYMRDANKQLDAYTTGVPHHRTIEMLIRGENMPFLNGYIPSISDGSKNYSVVYWFAGNGIFCYDYSELKKDNSDKKPTVVYDASDNSAERRNKIEMDSNTGANSSSRTIDIDSDDVIAACKVVLGIVVIGGIIYYGIKYGAFDVVEQAMKGIAKLFVAKGLFA